MAEKEEYDIITLGSEEMKGMASSWVHNHRPNASSVEMDDTPKHPEKQNWGNGLKQGHAAVVRAWSHLM